MRNLEKTYAPFLKLHYRFLRRKKVSQALAPWRPMGFCACSDIGGKTETACGGYAIDSRVPVEKNTIFRIASISKIFIAAAAARMVECNRLNLDADISEYLGFSLRNPRHPQIAVTMRQLLTHTAGICDNGGYNTLAGTENAPPLQEYFSSSETCAAQFFSFAPGEEFSYSNFGAGIAGMVLECVSGKFYDDLIRDLFLSEMDASFHPQRINCPEKMANCYRMPQKTLAYDAQKIASLPLETHCDPMAHYSVPAGKLMISAPDLLKALKSLMEIDLLQKLQNNIGSVKIQTDRTLSFASMPAGILADKALLGHQGMAYGVVCEAWFDPETKDAAVLLTNGLSTRTLGALSLGGQAGIAALLDRKHSDTV